MQLMKKFFLSIDQGTTSTRTVLYDFRFKYIDQEQIEIKQFYPKPGYVEHDAEEIWEKTYKTFKKLLKKHDLKPAQIISIGITNQRETVLGWNSKTGKPIGKAIVWQDRRTSAFCDSLKQKGLEPEINEKTGLLLDPYFSASKLSWLKNKSKAQFLKKTTLFGTIDSYLLWKLTEGRIYATDVTNAARTSLFNLTTLSWDQDLIKIFGLQGIKLPEIKNNADNFGVTNLFGGEIKISGMAGDQQAALFGQACFENGQIKSTYGTGCFLILNTGKEILRSKNKLLTTIGYKLDNDVNYALEGSIFVAGSLIQWLRDKMKFISSAPESEKLAKLADSDNEVSIIPSFTGLGAPYWKPDLKAAIHGLSLETSREDIVLASLEAIAFQTRDLLEALKNDGAEIKSIKIDGGMANNNFFSQILSDVLSIDIYKPNNIESTSLGAAYLAGIGADHVKLSELADIWKADKLFKTKKSYDSKYTRYLNRVNSLI